MSPRKNKQFAHWEPNFQFPNELIFGVNTSVGSRWGSGPGTGKVLCWPENGMSVMLMQHWTQKEDKDAVCLAATWVCFHAALLKSHSRHVLLHDLVLRASAKLFACLFDSRCTMLFLLHVCVCVLREASVRAWSKQGRTSRHIYIFLYYSMYTSVCCFKMSFLHISFINFPKPILGLCRRQHTAGETGAPGENPRTA